MVLTVFLLVQFTVYPYVMIPTTPTLMDVVSEKNSRSGSRSHAQSHKSLPGGLLTEACQCCEDRSSAVRKRLASHLDDDSNESSVTDRKQMRYSQEPSAGLAQSSRSVGAEVVKRRRGRPFKVSCLLVISQYSIL